MSIRLPIHSRAGVAAYTLIDEQDAHLANWRWYLSGGGYAYRSVYRTRRSPIAVYLHREVLGLTNGDGLVADHANHDRLDNRRANLRAVTQRANTQHRNPSLTKSATGIRNVYRDKGDKYKAVVTFCGRNYGRYGLRTVEEAAFAARELRERFNFLGSEAAHA